MLYDPNEGRSRGNKPGLKLENGKVKSSVFKPKAKNNPRLTRIEIDITCSHPSTSKKGEGVYRMVAALLDAPLTLLW